MEYRELPHGDEAISVIGMGSSVVGAQKEADIRYSMRWISRACWRYSAGRA